MFLVNSLATHSSSNFAYTLVQATRWLCTCTSLDRLQSTYMTYTGVGKRHRQACPSDASTNAHAHATPYVAGVIHKRRPDTRCRRHALLFVLLADWLWCGGHGGCAAGERGEDARVVSPEFRVQARRVRLFRRSVLCHAIGQGAGA